MFELVFVDVTNFVADPIRTGVQRVVASILTGTNSSNFIPFRVVAHDTIAVLDPSIINVFRRFFRYSATGPEPIRVFDNNYKRLLASDEDLIRFLAMHPVALIPSKRLFEYASYIVNLEAFTDQTRSHFYLSCPPNYQSKVLHLIHDLLIFQHPRLFPQLNWRYAADYIDLFAAYSVAGKFVVATHSLALQVSACFNRPLEEIKVVHFGGNFATSRSETARISSQRKRILVVGTIEPRKFPVLIFKALHRIMRDEADLECIVVGKWGWVTADQRQEIEAIIAQGLVSHLDDVADEELSDLIQNTNLAIYVSEQEGFGLPVIEFAYHGIKVITNSAVPSSEYVRESGIVLDIVSESTIYDALRQAISTASPAGRSYQWTWSDTAREIFENLSKPLSPSHIYWPFVSRLVREFKSRQLDWEEFKPAMKERFGEILIESGEFGAAHETSSASNNIERLCEIVSDNLALVPWADLMLVRPHIETFIQCLIEASSFDAISKGYVVVLGRAIDPRSANEISRLTLDGRIKRLLELGRSEESQKFLGPQVSVAFRSLLAAAEAVLNAVFCENIDLFLVHALIGLQAPTTAEIANAIQVRWDASARLRLLSKLVSKRLFLGSDLDLFMRFLSDFLEQERDDAVRSGTSEEDSEGGEVSVEALILPSSKLFRHGWIKEIRNGEIVSRRLSSSGVLANPKPDWNIDSIVLEFRAVKPKMDPLIDVFVGSQHFPLATLFDHEKTSLRIFKPHSASAVRLGGKYFSFVDRGVGRSDYKSTVGSTVAPEIVAIRIKYAP